MDYAPALLIEDDIAGMIPEDFTLVDFGDAAGTKLLAQCGKELDQEATAGAYTEFQVPESMSISSGVRAYSTTAEAEAEMAKARDLVEHCTTYKGTRTGTEDDLFVHNSGPEPADNGDETLVSYNSKADSGLRVADYFVRRGPFVLDIRVAAVGGSPAANPSVIDAFATPSAERFVAWADKQLAE